MMREIDESVDNIDIKKGLEAQINVIENTTLQEIESIIRRLDDFLYLESIGVTGISKARKHLFEAYSSLYDGLKEFKKYVETASEEELRRRIHDGDSIDGVINALFDKATVWFLHYMDDVEELLQRKQNRMPSTLLNIAGSMVDEIARDLETVDRKQYRALLEEHIIKYLELRRIGEEELASWKLDEIGHALDEALETIVDPVINKYWNATAINDAIDSYIDAPEICYETLAKDFDILLWEVCTGIWETLNGYDIASEVLFYK